MKYFNFDISFIPGSEVLLTRNPEKASLPMKATDGTLRKVCPKCGTHVYRMKAHFDLKHNDVCGDDLSFVLNSATKFAKNYEKHHDEKMLKPNDQRSNKGS